MLTARSLTSTGLGVTWVLAMILLLPLTGSCASELTLAVVVSVVPAILLPAVTKIVTELSRPTSRRASVQLSVLLVGLQAQSGCC